VDWPSKIFIHFVVPIILLLASPLSVAQKIQNTPASCPPIDSLITARIPTLHYSGSPWDRVKLQTLYDVYQNSVSYCLTEEDFKIFYPAFASYPNHMLMDVVLLDSAGNFRPAEVNIQVVLIESLKIYNVVPYLCRYLSKQKPERIGNWLWRIYLNILGESGRTDAKPFLRKQLLNISQIHRAYRGPIIYNLGKLQDSFDDVFNYCQDVIRQEIRPDSYTNPPYECAQTMAIYYNNHEYFGFIISNYLNSYNLWILETFMFPPFALDRSIYGLYNVRGTTSRTGGDWIYTIWKDWYRNNSENMVWSEDLQMFIEEGTENVIKDYWDNQGK